MSVICFVCNLPIHSHQVGLVWEGGNGWDEIQSDDSASKSTRTGRRDSYSQICCMEVCCMNMLQAWVLVI